MGRAWRIEYEVAFYHLMSRGNKGQDIYFAEDDRRLFLGTLSEMSERFEIEIYKTWCQGLNFKEKYGLQITDAIDMRIPVMSATHSGRSRPPVPDDLGR